MKRTLLIFLSLACLFLSGCDEIPDQVAQIPGVSQEILSLVESDSTTLDPAEISDMLGISLEGTGTKEDPYLIYQALDLFVLHIGPAALNKHYRLMNDISLPEVEEGENNWIPVGSMDEPFTGTFDGNGKKIEGMKIYFSEHDENLYNVPLGLFACISGEGAAVKNLSLANLQITITEEVTISVTLGSISGWLMEYATVENCFVSGNLTITNKSSKNIGGIVGYNNLGNIYECSASLEIFSINELSPQELGGKISYTGGIVGYNAGIVSNCATNISIKANDKGYIGGIAGANYREITSCYAVGNISGSNVIGGIVGSNYGTNFFEVTVKDCFSFINIVSSGNAGGIVGRNYDASIENCYALGTILAENIAGGITGTYSHSTFSYPKTVNIKNCFALQEFIKSHDQVGRIVGSYSSGILADNFAWIGVNITKNDVPWTIFENKNYVDGATVLIDNLLTNQLYESAGWSIGVDPSTWTIHDSFILPILNHTKIEWVTSYDISYLNIKNESFFTPFESLKGSGIESDPYLIFNLNDLNKLKEYPEYFSGSYYKLMNDISLERVEYNESNWVPLGTEKAPFKGIFDGNNKTISSLVIYNETDMDALGFFGYVDKSSKIYNLNLKDIKISYNPNIEAVVGGIAAQNDGVIENCSTSGKIAPATLVIPELENLIENEELLKSYWNLFSYAGGIAGINNGTISKSYSTVDMTITASGEFGGIAATNYNLIEKCHSAGSITHLFFNDPIHAFMTYSGGIAGFNGYKIFDCYSTTYISSQGIVGGIVGYNYFPEIQPSDTGLTEYHIMPTGDGGFQIISLGGDESDYKKSTVVINCYAMNETLQGSYACGGIVGFNSGIISSCVSLPESLESFMYLGLVAGFFDNYEDMINNYTSNEFGSDPSDPDTVTKKITFSRFRQKSFYQSLGWDFSETWDMKTGYDFPTLKGVGGQEKILTPLTYR